ncbi:methyl-accepting chemotaxis protein [Acidisphaera sp. L21]|uniref:methyl-accepting chemotaxis protein n=1 Tax=Acidisphaera sp. L21 TaxID=1641851 RepID=UPI00131ACF58|nr:methyl-accepting chemotaxis protein [Acidisphaera sp. L21]
MARDVAKPLWIKITAYGFAAVLLSSLAVGGLSFHRQYVAGEQDIADQVARDTASIETDMAAQRRAATGMALAMAGEPSTGELILANDRPTLLARFSKSLPAIASQADLRLLTFANAAGVAVARIHTPDIFGDNMLGRRRTIADTLKTGQVRAGLEPGREAMTIFGTAPVMLDGKVVGVADVGTALSNDYWQRLKTSLKANIAVHVENKGKFETQSSTFTTSPVLTAEELAQTFNDQHPTEMRTVNGRTYVSAGVVLKDFSGAKIGVLEIASDVTSVIAARTSALWAIALSTLLACSLVLVAFFFFARSLGGAIARLTRIMGQLAAGDLTVEVPGQAKADETGAMARAVQVFKEAGIEKCRLEALAIEQQRAAEESEARVAEQRAVAAAQQQAVVDGLAGGMNRLADGDLTVRLNEVFASEYESLRADFNAAVAQLQSTMSVIVTNTAGLRSGTSEITQAADDLSRRTEQQAASLEETAAALDEITATVRKTADGARSARDMTGLAKNDAEHSGSVVRDTVAAMSAIEKSAGQISQIIGVIDEIAFQTNLLALNAGVEAARAGDAGRGFAVVASEVRALAQRSAEAAKEIKALISTSTGQVSRGVDLVDETGRSLVRIVDHVSQISRVVSDIAASAEEQASGLAQVNTAVNQMDQVTQQNAAMVEESTAASHSLAQDTAELERLTAKFQIGEPAAPQRAPAKAPIVKMRSAAKPVAKQAAPPRRPSAPKTRGNTVLAHSADQDGWEEF